MGKPKKKKESTIYLKSFVIFEKCNTKNFIKNSEIYLNSIGIGIYIFSDTQNLRQVYSSAKNNRNLERLFEIYGEKNLVDFYKTFTSNSKLSNLEYDIYCGGVKNSAHINNENIHHSKYVGNLIPDCCDGFRRFFIYGNSKKTLSRAGYTISFLPEQ